MHRIEHQDGAVATIALVDTEAQSRVVVAPARGGMVTTFTVGAREILHLDRATFDDPKANVRGGIPVLFPSPGKLANDTWSWRGVRGAMKQHGFARNAAWTTIATGDDDGAWVTIALEPTDATRAQFPFEFRLAFTYRLRGASLAIEMRIANEGAVAMPFGVGFHPYFAVADADKGRVRIPTAATRAFDNKRKVDGAFTGFDLTAEEVDAHLHDHGGSEATLATPSGDVVLRGSAELTHWVVWTLRGKDFVCLEPWTCPGNALNTGEGLLVLEPGESREMQLVIEAAGASAG
ncbi:MAG TPA: galactose mutarotase [Polyangiaceae bacterium]|nr:galactose mutarotase [Polyangiaceae bacterium]